MKVLVTGGAGFIGSALAEKLAKRGDEVTAIDNLNSYYPVELKIARLRRMGFDFNDGMPEAGENYASSELPGLHFIKLDISDKSSLDNLLENEHFDAIINLAAQAGVRYSITNPYVYLESNLVGFLNILEGCRNFGINKLVFASSSSVYGLNSKYPYEETDKVDTPVSLYAATKKSNELMAHAYSKLYGISTVGLRYFTVYGPWGRPDMSPMLFATAIMKGEPIKVFNHGDMMRDFTYIDDIVDGTIGALDLKPEPNENGVLYHIYNIGGSNTVKLMDFIRAIENACGREAVKEMLPMQPGDVYMTSADTTRLETATGVRPSTKLEQGIQNFIEWFRSDLNPLKPTKL